MPTDSKVELEGQYYAEDFLDDINRRMKSVWNLHGIHHCHLNTFIKKK